MPDITAAGVDNVMITNSRSKQRDNQGIPETESREWPSRHCMASAAGAKSLKLTRAYVLPGNTLTASRGPNLPKTVSMALSLGRVAMLPSSKCLLGCEAAARHKRDGSNEMSRCLDTWQDVDRRYRTDTSMTKP